MNTQLKVIIAALGVAGIMPIAHAHDEYAPVTSVTPHVTTVNQPERVCHTESTPIQREQHWYGDNVTYQEVEKCMTVDHYTTQTNGYTVTYEYNGRSYTTDMPYDPGRRVRIAVDVQPS